MFSCKICEIFKNNFPYRTPLRIVSVKERKQLLITEKQVLRKILKNDHENTDKRDLCTVWNVSKYGVFSGPYFPAFELNT